MPAAKRVAVGVLLGAALGCAGPPTADRGVAEITFTPAAVVNPGPGGSVTVSATVRGLGAGPQLRWESLAPAVVQVEPAADGRTAVLRFAAQQSAGVVLSARTPEGTVVAVDTLLVGSISSIGPNAAPRP